MRLIIDEKVLGNDRFITVKNALDNLGFQYELEC